LSKIFKVFPPTSFLSFFLFLPVSSFWVSGFSDFDFRSMGTEFLGRKISEKAVWLWEILWVL